jgi:hypothetical protein
MTTHEPQIDLATKYQATNNHGRNIMWKWVTNYQKALERTIQILNKTNVTYMLIGGVAVSYYGFPRLTPAIDVMLKLDLKEAKDLITHAKKAGLKFDKKGVLALIDVGNWFVAEFGDCAINFWLAKWKLDYDMLTRRRRATISGRKVWICSPEDLIILELTRGGEWDHGDILGILIRQRQTLKIKDLVHLAHKSNADSTKLLKLIEDAAKYNSWAIRKTLS